MWFSAPVSKIDSSAPVAVLRRSELRGIRWEDLSDTELKISRSVWNTHIEERTKTTASKAPIPLVPILQKWLAVHRNGSTTEGFIFAGSKTGRPLNLANLARRIIVPALKQNGIEWHGWHAFRRGLGTNLYRIGTPDKTIQAILRHANVSTTLNIYVKPVAADSQVAMQKLERAFKVAGQVARQAIKEKAIKAA
jgi:integrase